MNQFPKSTLVEEVKSSDLGGCKNSADFLNFAKARGGEGNEFPSLTYVKKSGKTAMFSTSKVPYSIEYRKLLMRVFIAMGFLKFIVLLGVILAVIGLLHFTGIV
jgi:hypothetical protein